RGGAQRDSAGSKGTRRGEASRPLARFLGFVRETQRTTDRLHCSIGFFAEQTTHVADFVVDGFERNVFRHHARKIVLQNRAEYAARDSNDQQPHQNPRERSSKMKPAVKKNQGKREKTKPEMAAHPGLRAAKAPCWNALARAKRRGKKHERETNNAKH